MATNAVTFRLQRHSDHHAHADRPYHRLRDVGADAAPTLPASYPAMVILAHSPALWRAVMDPHADRARARVAAAKAAAGRGVEVESVNERVEREGAGAGAGAEGERGE